MKPSSIAFPVPPAVLLKQVREERARREAAKRQREIEEHAAEIRGRCQSLAGFIQEAWPVLEPNIPLIWNWHLDALCEHLEAITFGDITRLLVNVPPGSSKSLVGSVMWPAWEWAMGFRSKRYLTTSHNDIPVKRDTRKMRDLILSDWYQALWPEVRLVRAGETSFANSDTGTREGVAFKSLTSQRADCVVGSTEILTDIGSISVENIVVNAVSCNVLSYDKHSGKLVYRPVQAVARCVSADLYRVHTADGRVVECTSDHRFYTARGYVPARFLSEGDVLLLAVRCTACQNCGTDEGQCGSCGPRTVLQSHLRDDAFEFEAGEDRKHLHDLRAEGPAREGRLLPRMSASVAKPRGISSSEGSSDCNLRNLRIDIPSEIASAEEPVLFPSLQGHGAFSSNAGGSEPRLAGRGFSATVLEQNSVRDECYSPANLGAGRKEVRRLRVISRAVHASHRHEYGEQSPVQSGDPLQTVPHGISCCGTGEAAEGVVALVERVCGQKTVYDLQVAETECFFANGVLVHNCLIIDDPHSVETAESDAERENTTRRFREGAINRLNDQAKSAILVVMQRLHEDDVSGVILSNDMGFEHLCLPMEFEPDRRCETSIGFVDPRRNEGELLDPVRFPRKVVEGLKRDMGSFAWAGQYQQRPSARGGGIITRDGWRLWDDDTAKANDLKSAAVFPPMLYVVGSLDPAYTEKQQNDPSGFTIWGIWKDRGGRKRLMLMYAWAERLALHDLVEKAAKDCRRFRADLLLIEAKASGLSVAQEIRRLYANEDWSVRLVSPDADKVARAYQTQPMFEQGLIWAPDRTWAQRVIDEAAVFPRGKHDDLVDSTTQALTAIRKAGLLALSGETHDDWDKDQPRPVDSLYW